MGLLVASHVLAAPPSFRILGSEQNVFHPVALSGNGERVVGIYELLPGWTGAYVDWRTSLSPVMLRQGTPLSPVAVSFDGSVIVGSFGTPSPQPFRWINGTVSFVAPPPSGFAYCHDVSGDGSTLVARSYDVTVGDSGAVWNLNTGWTFLPQIPPTGCHTLSEPTAISGNGAVVIGSARRCETADFWLESEGVIWTPAATGLGYSEGEFATYASGISADGATIVGAHTVALGPGDPVPLEIRACRWTSAGIEYLAPALVDLSSYAADASGDGRVIVGRHGYLSFLWIQGVGLMDLTAYATSLVGDLGGWQLQTALKISDDGRVIIGLASRGGPSTTYVLDLGTPCIADFNQDGTVDFFDYLDFAQEFSTGNPAADVNGDQVVDFFDYLDFVQLFAAGC